MSEQQETKYFERLNISVLSINRIKSLIKKDIQNTLIAWDKGKEVDKQCFHIIGPAGVGKTAICGQIQDELTKELGIPCEMIMIKSPVISRDDMILPFPVLNKDGVDDSFKMLYSDFVPKDPNSFGLFVIDEFSRGDHALQQLLWQIQNEYKVHLQDFPKRWFVISIDNPDDQEYSIDTLEDAAGLRRQLHVYTEVNTQDFLTHAIDREFHPMVIEFIQTHPDYLYDFDAQKIGSVFANPASYEKLSDHLWKYDLSGELAESFDNIELLASGLLNVNKARLFMEFARDKKDINPKDIFYKYETVRKRIQDFVKKGDNASLGNVMTSFVTYLTSSKPDFAEKEKVNVAKFLSDCPVDTSAIFVTTIDTFDRSSDEFQYVTNLHVEMMHIPDYKTKFYEAVVHCSSQNGK